MKKKGKKVLQFNKKGLYYHCQGEDMEGQFLHITIIKMKNNKVRINVEDEQEGLFGIYVGDEVQCIVRGYDKAEQARDEYEQRQYDIEEAAMDMEGEFVF